MRYERVPVRAHCPICQGSEGIRLYRVGTAEAAAHFVPEAQSPTRYQSLKAHVETLWRGGYPLKPGQLGKTILT